MIIYLLRGVPGCGKTTLAQTLGCVYHSADDYFMNPVTGDYEFEASHLPKAHSQCSKRTEAVMIEGQPVAVANTFTRKWEMKVYYELAKKYNYTIFSVIVENRHNGVNEHGVPDAALKAMKERFDVML